MFNYSHNLHKLFFPLFLSLFLLFCSSPLVFAATPDLSGSWIVQEIISNNATLDIESISASLSLEPAELMSLQLSPYGYGKLLFCSVVYPVELRALGNGTYALTGSDTGFLLSLADDGALFCTLQDNLSLSLIPTTGNDISFENKRSVSNALDEAVAAQALAASLRSGAVQLFLPFSEQETQAMSNFMLHGRYWLDGNTLYGMAFDKNSPLPDLVRSEISLFGDLPEVGICEALDRHVNANFLTPVDNWLYYIRYDRDSNIASLSRMNLITLEPEIIFSDGSDLSYLQFRNGRLYFTHEYHHFYSSDLNGNDLQPVLEKEVYYPYFLDDNRILYQDSADGESFHLFCCSDDTDLKITNTPSFYPIISGSSLYFLSAEDNVLHLSRMDLSNPSSDADLPFPIETSTLPFSEEFAIANGKIYGYNRNEADLTRWSAISDARPGPLSRHIFYVSDSCLISAEMDDYGGRNVRAIYLVNLPSMEEGVFRHVY